MAQFIHKRLARRPGIWRVDGIGPIRVRGRLGVRAVVYFSGLSEVGLEQPYWKASLNGLTLELPVHSASLRDFKVGSIWRDGKRIAGAVPIETTYDVDVSQVRLVTLDQAIKLNDSWASTVVPDSNFYFGTNRSFLSQTLYAIAPVLGDRKTQWLVVPASELLRFYIGVSSRLLSGALQGRLESYVNWGKSRMEGGRPVLHVKQRLNRKEAAVLSRAIASKTAMTTLLGVHQYLSSVHANNAVLDGNMKRPLVIKANFPFSDQTRLVVSGKRMPLTTKGTSSQWAVFAMELLSCSHPFGFSGLVLESDESFESEYQQGEGGGSKPPKFSPQFEDDEDDYEVDDLPADQRLRRLVVRSYTNQFGEFDRLEFEHRRPKSDSSINRPGTNIEVPINALTNGDGSHTDDSKGNLGVSDFQNRIEQIDRDLSLFLEMLEQLRNSTGKFGWKITTRRFQSGGLTQGTEQIALFPEKVGKRRSWHIVVEPGGNIRPRQVIWAEIAIGAKDRLFYLLEMELKPGESGQCTILLYMNDFSRLDDDTFKELLLLTAIQNRWPDRHNKWKEAAHSNRANALFSKIQMHRIHHPPVPRQKKDTQANKPTLNPKSWSEVLLEQIDELLPA